jgi:hypothetical protein
MKFISNYSDWITPELMNHIKTHDGDHLHVFQPWKWKGDPKLEEALEKCRPGYEHTTHGFQQFNSSSTDMKNFQFDLPLIPNDNRKKLWWIVKLLPGQMQPMHFDPHLIEIKNPQRYTMFLQDWESGHIFVYIDKYISNYKAGDLYQWDDPMMEHGVVNIGFNTRYTLQITTYDE